MTPLNPFTSTAFDLQSYLSAGKTNSTSLIELYLEQIAQNNEYLRAVIATTPTDILVRQAAQLDDERAAGKVRSKLHGIPILVKDNIATDPSLGMNTTAGSYALAGSRPHRHADVVQKLVDAGVIILGKASLSEFSFYRSEGIPCGWCAVSGQAQSAYVRGGFRKDDTFAGHSNPGGSSSGPAIAVSAGFAPIAIGTETIGSLITPADRAALYTIKPTMGLISQRGIVPISPLCDTAGPMAKSTMDLADLLDILVDPSTTKIPAGGYASAVSGQWGSIKVGILEPKDWLHGEGVVKYEKEATDQMLSEIHVAYAKLATYVPVTKVSLLSWDEAADKGNKVIDKCFGYDNQNGLIRALNSNLSDAEYEEILSYSRRAGRELGIDKVLKETGVDVIIGPAGGALPYISGVAGYPIGSLPLGYLDFNGRPFGLVAMVSAHQESLLLQVLSAWEATFPARKPPPLLADKWAL